MDVKAKSDHSGPLGSDCEYFLLLETNARLYVQLQCCAIIKI
jgi:hypothetical protein